MLAENINNAELEDQTTAHFLVAQVMDDLNIYIITTIIENKKKSCLSGTKATAYLRCNYKHSG